MLVTRGRTMQVLFSRPPNDARPWQWLPSTWHRDFCSNKGITAAHESSAPVPSSLPFSVPGLGNRHLTRTTACERRQRLGVDKLATRDRHRSCWKWRRLSVGPCSPESCPASLTPRKSWGNQNKAILLVPETGVFFLIKKRYFITW